MILRQIKSQVELRDVYNFIKRNLNLKESHPRDLQFYLEEFNKHPELMLVALDKRLIGALLANVEDDHVLIGELVVSAAYRKKGIGSQLLSKLETKARETNQHTLLLGAREEAELFYVKNNYQPKLFIQLTGNDSEIKLDKLLQGLPEKYIVSWKNYSNNTAKAIILTKTLDKILLSLIREKLKGVHTQYLFSKQI